MSNSDSRALGPRQHEQARQDAEMIRAWAQLNLREAIETNNVEEAEAVLKTITSTSARMLALLGRARKSGQA